MAKRIEIERVWPTPALIRAARGLLGIGQEELADRAGFARKTVIGIELHVDPTMDERREESVRALAVYLEAQGLEFLRPTGKEGAGVRFADDRREMKVVADLRSVIEDRRAERLRKPNSKTKQARKAKKRRQ
jgi:DNA-binding XRE family transcriptional regulator